MTGRDSGALSMNKAIEKTLHVLKKVYIYKKQSQKRMCIQRFYIHVACTIARCAGFLLSSIARAYIRPAGPLARRILHHV